MFKDLYDNWHYEPRDIANRIVKAALKEDFITIKETKGGVQFLEPNIFGVNDKVSFFDIPGLYAIYKGKTCLYVGMTGRSVYNRIYRFQKHLKGRSRHDESHPAAEKARKDGIKTLHNARMKFFPMESVEKIINEICSKDPDYNMYKNFPIDEWIAPLLKAKYNTRKVGA